MKRILFFLMFFALLALTSCSKVVEVKLELTPKWTRTSEPVKRYVMEVYEGTEALGVPIHRFEQSKRRFNVSLKSNKKYVCLFWADGVAVNGNATGVYDTSNLRDVKVNAGQQMSEAYFARYDVTISENQDHDITLKLAVAQVNFISAENPPGDVELKTEYLAYNSFNVSNGEVVGTPTLKANTFKSSITNRKLGSLLAFANGNGMTTDFSFISGENVKNSIKVPLKTYTTTNITGDFFVQNNMFTVESDQEWGDMDTSVKGNSKYPDAAFLAHLVSRYDTNNDGDISHEEALKVTEISCNHNKEIESLEGIENFVNLTHLDCYGNNRLTTLDVSKNSKLTSLSCHGNRLTTLDVSNNKALTFLLCSDNQITTLDLSKNRALTSLNCFSETLTTIILDEQTFDGIVPNRDPDRIPEHTNISGNIYIADADFKAYLVEEFDTNNDGKISFEEALKVTEIDCENLAIESLEGIGYFVNLTSLNCSYNQLARLDVTKNSKLTFLDCSPMATLTILSLDLGQTIDGIVPNRDPDLVPAHTEIPRNINFPDEVFKAYLVSHYDTNDDGEISYEEALLITGISFSVDETADELMAESLEGIEYFVNLTYLDCSGNNLTTLDVSKNIALTGLDCTRNQLTALDVSKNIVLIELRCFGNKLTILDVSKNIALTLLGCADNQLTALDVSKNTKLTDLYCSNNELTTLDVSKNIALKELECASNQLTTLDVSKHSALTELNCSMNKITTLDVSKNIALTKLSCFENELTTLDVSKNSALTELSCFSNSLTTLDLSKNIALNRLNCSSNRLTTLDLSKNIVLTSLYCDDNSLTTLDLGSALVEMRCSGNKLTALDVSKSRKLTNLNCSSNKLTTLDLSKNIALNRLNCSSNRLTTLDLSKNIVLTSLYCEDNILTSLDLSNNIALYKLNCDDNSLTTLDLSKNIALVNVECSSNSLTTLQLPNSSALKILVCGTNKLTALDLSENTKLYEFGCIGNQLTTLDLSKNIALGKLDCKENLLTTLDLSKNFKLYRLLCSPMPTLKTLTLKTGQTIYRVTSDRNIRHIPEHTNIKYVD